MYFLLFSVALLLLFFLFAIATHVYVWNTLIALCLCCILVGYIRTSINDGPGCLMLRCPDPSCGAAVGQDMINIFACDDDRRKYSKYLLRSFVEDNKKVYVKIYNNQWIFIRPLILLNFTLLVLPVFLHFL